MKKLFSVWVIALLTSVSVFAGDIVTRNVNKLPAAARKSIQTNFPKLKISYIKIDKELMKRTTYEAVLTDGTEVEFDSDGQWIEVDCKRSVVPAAYIPAKIRQYVNTEFPGCKITKIERKRRSYEIDLDNGLDVTFDMQGNFLRLDD